MTGQSGPGLAYRPDIDGLRALSVVLVLAFHAGLAFVPGGFVGVDIFFVISGYLITSLLLKEFDAGGRISLINFWARRMRRLAPALLLVVGAVVVASTILLQRLSGETGNLAKAALATLLINANHYFLVQSNDYFAASAETNPMLHMWSLSVEEQFYLAWPLLMLFCLRFRGKAMGRNAALLILAASLAYSCYLTAAAPTQAFYLMPSRAWELMAGALLGFASSHGGFRFGRTAAETMSVLGLAGIAVSAACFSAATRFPGPAAVLPVAGAMLMLAAGGSGHRTWVSRATMSRPAVYLGKISYPLYLWHWPVLVIMRSRRLYQEAPWLDLLGLAIAAMLAILTYEFVEKSAWRKVARWRPGRTILAGLAASAALCCLALLIGAWTRFGWGYSPAEARLDASRKDTPGYECLFDNWPLNQGQAQACFPKSDNPAVLLWGDSHAHHWLPPVAAAAGQLKLNLATMTMRACRPLAVRANGDACEAFNRWLISNLPEWRAKRRLAGIVISADWVSGMGVVFPDKPGEQRDSYFDRRAHDPKQAQEYLRQELHAVLSAARDNGLRVLLVMPSPVQRFAPAHCLSVAGEKDCKVTLAAVRQYMRTTEKTLRSTVAEFDMVRLIEPVDFLCRDGVCPAIIDGVIAYSDDDHLSKTFTNSRVADYVAGLAWLEGK